MHIHRYRSISFTRFPTPVCSHIDSLSGINLGIVSSNESRRYNVTPSLIGRVNTQNDPCLWAQHYQI